MIIYNYNLEEHFGCQVENSSYKLEKRFTSFYVVYEVSYKDVNYIKTIKRYCFVEDSDKDKFEFALFSNDYKGLRFLIYDYALQHGVSVKQLSYNKSRKL